MVIFHILGLRKNITNYRLETVARDNQIAAWNKF